MDEALVGLLSALATALLAVAAYFTKQKLGGEKRGLVSESEDIRPAREVRMAEEDRHLVVEQNRLISHLSGQTDYLIAECRSQTATISADLKNICQQLLEERREAAARAARTEEQLRQRRAGQ